MDQIAVLVGSNHETISFTESGIIKVYQKKDKNWQIIRELLFTISQVTSIKEAREKVMQIGKELGECHIIVGSKVDGIAYNVFEMQRLSIWEFEGKPQEFLDYILEKEEEDISQREAAKEQSNQEIAYIKELAEGYHVIDLEQMQSAHRSITSKQALIPVLEKGGFRRLDIICSHIPPWIENQIERYQLQMETETLCTGNYKVTLISKLF